MQLLQDDDERDRYSTEFRDGLAGQDYGPYQPSTPEPKTGQAIGGQRGEGRHHYRDDEEDEEAISHGGREPLSEGRPKVLQGKAVRYEAAVVKVQIGPERVLWSAKIIGNNRTSTTTIWAVHQDGVPRSLLLRALKATAPHRLALKLPAG